MEVRKLVITQGAVRGEALNYTWELNGTLVYPGTALSQVLTGAQSTSAGGIFTQKNKKEVRFFKGNLWVKLYFEKAFVLENMTLKEQAQEVSSRLTKVTAAFIEKYPLNETRSIEIIL
jgi:hypothetical protein